MDNGLPRFRHPKVREVKIVGQLLLLELQAQRLLGTAEDCVPVSPVLATMTGATWVFFIGYPLCSEHTSVVLHFTTKK